MALNRIDKSMIDPEFTKEINDKFDEVNTQLAQTVTKEELNALDSKKAEREEVDSLAANKADKTYVDNNIANVNSRVDGIDRGYGGTFATLADLETAYPNGDSKRYVVTEDGCWYYWHESNLKWTNGGVFQSTGIPHRSIPYEKTDFIVVGKNIFNKDDAPRGQIISHNTGKLSDNDGYRTSGFIPILPSTTYVRSGTSASAVFFDQNKEFISGIAMGTGTFETPSNAAYMRTSFAHHKLDVLQIEIGDTPTPYEPYQRNILGITLLENQLPKSSTEILDKTTSLLNKLKTRKNLFNKDTITKGYLVSHTTGKLQANVSYSASDFIKIEPDTVYTRTHDLYMAFYDENKQFISGFNLNQGNLTFITPSNAYYLRTTVIGEGDSFQLEKGDTRTPYEPFRQYFDGILPHGSLEGKTGVAFGDSITQGATFPGVISANTGANFINCGFGATRLIRLNHDTYPYAKIGMCEIADCIASGDWTPMEPYIQKIDESREDDVYSTIFNRLKSIDFNEVDFITIMYGTNDLNSIESVGTLDSTDTYTTHGALNHVITSVLSVYPHIRIYLLSPIFKMRIADDKENSDLNAPNGVYLYEIAEAISQQAKKWHLPFKDMYNESGINALNAHYYLSDGVHPNDAGKELMARVIQGFLVNN